MTPITGKARGNFSAHAIKYTRTVHDTLLYFSAARPPRRYKVIFTKAIHCRKLTGALELTAVANSINTSARVRARAHHSFLIFFSPDIDEFFNSRTIFRLREFRNCFPLGYWN